MDRSTLWFRYWPMAAVGIGLHALESAWWAIGLYHLGLIAFISLKRDRLREVRWTSPVGLSLALYGIGMLTAPFVYYVLPLLAGPDIGAALGPRLEVIGLGRGAFVGFVIYFSTIHPVLEEAGWRAALKTEGRAPRLHDFEFAAYHLLVMYYLFPGNWLVIAGSLIVLTTSAWSWRQLRDRHGMAAVIAFHAAADLAVFLAVFRLTAG